MTTESRGSNISESFRFTWEDWDSCLQEPFKDEERYLLKVLQSLGEFYAPAAPPPLWEHAEFVYNPKNPEQIAPFHYCLVNDNQFVFCGDDVDCKCDESKLYYHSVRKEGVLSKKMLLAQGKPNISPKELELQKSAVALLSKRLRNNCDKIFDYCIPFVIEAHILSRVTQAISSLYTNKESLGDEKKASKEELEYQDLVMFLSDFCQQTPSLCISHSNQRPTLSFSEEAITSISSNSATKPKNSSCSSSPQVSSSSSIDISLFKNLQVLELRSTPPSKLSGVASLRMKLQKVKCSRCVKSIGQMLSIPNSSCSVAQIWPELTELDLSYNQIMAVGLVEVGVLELCPSLLILNLSRNKIVGVDDRFSRSLASLTVLNLSYNKLTAIPPIPPNVKTLLLSHNLIPNLNVPSANKGDTFMSMTCPLKHVEVLDLSTNLISKETDLLPLKEMTNLKRLSLSGNPFSFTEGYRRSVGGYLSRYAISRKFELDQRNFSSSEVKNAIEDSKQGKFIPYIPANSLLISQASSAMSASSTNSEGSISNSAMQNAKTPTTLHIMTQSFDSTSSSMKSLRRKKPKIREIINMDFPEDGENSYNTEVASCSSSSLQGCSEKSKDKRSQEIDGTRKALKALREKYGPEHWLLRQAGTEVDKLLQIPPQPINYDMFSRSLPHNHRDLSQSSFNSTRSPPTSSLYYDRAMAAAERYTNEEVLLIKSRKGKGQNSKEDKVSNTSSPKTVKEEKEDEEEDEDFFPEPSIFDLSKDEPAEDVFIEEPGKDFVSFRIYQSGELLKLIVFDGYLMEVNPSDNVILNKWDLNCLFALEEEKCDAETESVQFRLKFDTMRKTMREKSFIMGSKEFSVFDKLVSPYIEERTLQEFTEALQCTKCYAQFSRAMAGKTVKYEKGFGPRQVRICPNPECENDVLVTLDNIPLPNNECLDVEELEDGHIFPRGPLKASTPVSARHMSSLSQSIPKGKSPRLFDFMRLLPSSLSSRNKSSPTNAENVTKTNSKNNLESAKIVRAATKSTTPTSSVEGGATNTKSESDIEVLSTDSSSIEVLGKHCPNSESGSEVDVEEAIEIPVLDNSHNKSGNRTVVMSESTSSSSCADSMRSIVTTYEKNLLPISQPLSSPSRIPTANTSSSSSYASTSTLTTNSPYGTCFPVKYDYENFSKTDHRLQLWADVTVFKADERLLALTKCVIISDSTSAGNFLGIVIFSSKKVYFYRITGNEGDRPQEWLQKFNSFDISKFNKLDVLIGRHGVGVDFSGKYFALFFRDSERTSGFLEFFMSDICGELKAPPMVRDFSQTQKMMLSPDNPISYFGILRFSMCDSVDNAYALSAVLLTNEEILLISDLGWMAGRCDKVSTTHGRQLKQLRQVEQMETEGSFIRLVFALDADKIVNWELIFETTEERGRFEEALKSDLNQPEVQFLCLSQPLES